MSNKQDVFVTFQKSQKEKSSFPSRIHTASPEPEKIIAAPEEEEAYQSKKEEENAAFSG